MGLVEWGKWGLVAVMGGIVFYQVLADSREISRTGIQVSRKFDRDAK